MVLDHVLLHFYPTTDSNIRTGMITLNMLSAAEECSEPSGKCQGLSHCLESGHLQWLVMTTTGIVGSSSEGTRSFYYVLYLCIV